MDTLAEQVKQFVRLTKWGLDIPASILIKMIRQLPSMLSRMGISWTSKFNAELLVVSKVVKTRALIKSCDEKRVSSKISCFSGYLIAVEKDGRQVGEFLISGHKAMGCATKNSGITHSNPTSRRSVKAKWQIPANLQGSNVEVRATVVYQYSRAGHQRRIVKLWIGKNVINHCVWNSLKISHDLTIIAISMSFISTALLYYQKCFSWNKMSSFFQFVVMRWKTCFAFGENQWYTKVQSIQFL